MDEGEWVNATDPQAMLDFLRATDRATERKRRLFAVACCRRIWHLLTDERSRRAVELSELFADRGVSVSELNASRVAGYSAWFEVANLHSSADHAAAAGF